MRARFEAGEEVVIAWRVQRDAPQRHLLMSPLEPHLAHVLCYTRIASEKGNRIMLAIRLPADVEARLDALARATGRTKTFYAREAILQHLEDLEDLYLAEQRLIAGRAGKSGNLPLEDVMKRSGMED